MKWIQLLATVLFLNMSLCLATDTTTVTKAQLDAEIKKTTDKIDAVEKTAAAFKDSINKAQAAKSSPDSSLFTAWQAAKKNPCAIYNGTCNNCPTGEAACAGKSNAVIKIITWLLLAAILFVAFRHFFTSALCRDESYTDGAGQLNLRPAVERPYSYARTQLFWWSIIIFSCYAIFFALYGNLLPLNPTCVLLLGGGLATQLLGKTIDKNQLDNTTQGRGTNAVPNPTRHQDTNPSRGLLTDILSDENGISIHRLQSVAFNIIYGIGFIGYFMKSVGCCQYPFIDFEGWQLTLLGISTAGYLGMKTTENSKTTEPARIASAENNSAGAGK